MKITAKKVQELGYEKKEKARKMMNRLSSDSHPTDFVDEWKAEPGHDKIEWIEGSKEKKFVNPADIIGTDGMNTDRFVVHRVEKILKRLLHDRYHLRPDHPPRLHEIDGKYFVGGDGNHRSLVFKHLGIDRMWAEVTRYELKCGGEFIHE